LASAPNGIFTISGNGQLLVPSNTTTQIFNVSVAYDQAAKRSAFNTLEQNLNLKFTDDFVLFGAGIGLQITPSQRSGRCIAPGPAIAVTFHENPPSVSFSGALDFRDIGFQVPGLTNLAVEVCSAKLVFPTNQLPRLTNFNASIQLPIPGQTSRVDIASAAFSL